MSILFIFLIDTLNRTYINLAVYQLQINAQTQNTDRRKCYEKNGYCIKHVTLDA